MQAQSIAGLRSRHSTLLQRERGGTRPTPAEILEFLQWGSALGRVLEDMDERDTAQGILDYWVAKLLSQNPMAVESSSLFTLAPLGKDSEPLDSTGSGGFPTRPRISEASLEAILNLKSLPSADNVTLSGGHSNSVSWLQLVWEAMTFAGPRMAQDKGYMAVRRLLLQLARLKEDSLEVYSNPLSANDPIFKEPQVQAVVGHLENEGLLVRTVDPGMEGGARIALAHEGLLTEWPLLRELIKERKAFREMARGWVNSGKPQAALLNGGTQLQAAKKYRDLNQEEKDFLDESQDRTDFGKRKGLAIAVAICVVLTGMVSGLIVSLSAETQLRKKLEDSIIQEAALRAETDRLRGEESKLKEREAQAKLEAETAATAAAQAQAARERLEKQKALEDAEQLKRKLAEQVDTVNRLRAIVDSSQQAIASVDQFKKLLGEQLPPAESERLKPTFEKLASAQDSLNYGLEIAKQGALSTQKIIDVEIPLAEQAKQAQQTVAREPKPRLVKTLEGDGKPITALTFAGDGRLATASEGNMVKIWSPAGVLLQEIQGSSRDGVNALAFNPGQRVQRLLIGSNGSTVRVYNFEGSRTSAYDGHRDSITSVAFDSSGTLALSASGDKTVQLWDPATMAQKGKYGPFSSIPTWAAFNPAGTKVIASFDNPDNSAFLWSIEGGEAPIRLKMQAPVKRGVFNRDGSLVVTAGSGDKTAAIWDAGSGSQKGPLLEHRGTVFQAIFHPTRDQVATASGDMTIKLWNGDGTCTATLTGHQGEVRSLVYNRNGTILLSGSSDSTARLWFDGENSARHVLTGHSRRITAAAFNEAGDQIATGSQDGTVRLWNFKVDTGTAPADTKTGWSFYGRLDPKAATPRFRAQSFAPETGERTLPPQPGTVVVAEAVMAVRESVEPTPDGRWKQGNAIDFLKKGDRVKVLKVIGVTEGRESAWIQFEKLNP